MNTSSRADFDVIVVGGGRAGSTLATFVAMQGHRVLLLEKHRFPIYKIGESLLPATVHGICPMLGVGEALKNANFVVKRGGTFLWGSNPKPWNFSFSASPRMAGPTSTAYQVERMKFDLILLNNAKHKGVDVREEHSATSVISEGGRVVGVEFTDQAGNTRECRARYVIDASGHQNMLARELGERVYSRFFQNVALFAYYQGAGRLPPPNEGNIFCVAFEYGWFWYIPLSKTLTSVGAVIAKEHASRLAGGHESAFKALISACPPIQQLLAKGQRVIDGPYSELRLRKDYSYSHTHFWRPGMALIGDAACFIDPVFSSGVHLATYSALLAARSINTCLKGLVDEVRSFSEFERRYRKEFANFYDFLLGFYDMNQDLDSYFWHARKVVNSPERGNEPFINLVAGVASSGERLYSSSEKFLQERRGLGGLLFPHNNGGAFDKESKVRREKFYSSLVREIRQVQLQAAFHEKRPAETPIFPGGLVPSRDGLHWTEARFVGTASSGRSSFGG